MSVAGAEGLEGVTAADSSICTVDGLAGKLTYAGYSIKDLAEHSSFEETTYLLWHGELPTESQLEQIRADLAEAREVPDWIVQALSSIPGQNHPMTMLRTGVSLLGSGVYGVSDDMNEVRRQAVRLAAAVPTLVAIINAIRQGKPIICPDQSLGHSANFLRMLTGAASSPKAVKCFDILLILHAEHELNASTFAGRVTAATLSSMYDATISGIAALSGPLHGGANEAVMAMLKQIGAPENAKEYVDNAFADRRKIMGFGHRVYKTWDPRALILRQMAEDVGGMTGTERWINISIEVEKAVRSHRELYPNVDYFSPSVYAALGVPTELFTPVFAASRTAGWTAHFMEQYANNRLIRPRANYVGPPERSYLPLAERE